MHAALLAVVFASGVAPWDVPDAPNPDPSLRTSSPLVTAPAAMLQAEGGRATLANGISVELRAVGRRRWSREPSEQGTMFDARPVWQPDGSPYLGPQAENPEVEHAILSHPLGGLMRPFDDGKEFDDKGARYLTFRVSGPPGIELDLYGYVPETARIGEPRPERHGRDVPVSKVKLIGGRADYETEIVVDDRSVSHYRFAVAAGEWKVAATVPLDITAFVGLPEPKTPSGKVLVARGAWGELWQDASEYDRLRGAKGYSGPGPRLKLAVVQPEPLRAATRLRFVDAKGESRVVDELLPWNEFRPIRVEVETRPYAWVEFSNVHYDPDPAKWPEAYWGAEGERAASRAEGAVLRAIVDPTFAEGKLFTTHVYAPDGKLWRAFPDPWAVSWTWIVETDMPGKLLAHLRLTAEQPDKKIPNDALVQTYASQSDVPGQGLAEPLAEPRWGGESTLIPFVRPAAPYVQFRVSRSLPWKKAGEIAPPTSVEIDRLAKRGSQPVSERPSLWVIAEAAGHADIIGVEGAVPSRNNIVVWPVGDPGERARIVVRTRDGVRHYAQGFAVPGIPYSRHTEALFTPDGKGDVVFKTWEGIPAKESSISLRDVSGFEIETQGYAPPVYLVAKTPVKK